MRAKRTAGVIIGLSILVGFISMVATSVGAQKDPMSKGVPPAVAAAMAALPNCDNSHPGTTIPAKNLAACDRENPSIPHTVRDIGLYAMGNQPTVNPDGSLVLFCPAPQGGMMPVPAGTKRCLPPGGIATTPATIAGGPIVGNPFGNTGVSCQAQDQKTKQEQTICETGVNPGAAVNNTPGGSPDPNCTHGHDGCFDLNGREHDAQGRIVVHGQVVTP